MHGAHAVQCSGLPLIWSALFKLEVDARMTIRPLSQRSLFHRLMRTILQVDHPILQRSDDEVEAEARTNFRWNFTVNFLDGAFFWFGNSFISAATILPLFLSKLTTHPMLIGLLAILGTSSWYLPQLFSAGVIERLPRKKPVVVSLGLLTERLPLWLLPLAALLSTRLPSLAIALFFVAYALHGLGAGIIAPAWTELIARCFPVRSRGRFFGVTFFVGTGLGTLGAIFGGWLLDAIVFPLNFTYAFAIAAAAVSLSWIFLAMTREPVPYVEPTNRPAREQTGAKVGRILAADVNFRNFLAARLIGSLGAMGLGFVTISAIQRWEVGDSTVALYTATMLIGQTAGNLFAGLMGDRSGHTLTLLGSVAASAIAYAIAWLTPVPSLLFLVFFCLGTTLGVSLVSGVLMPLEFTEGVNRPTYVGLANTTLGAGSVIAPLIGGLLASASYSLLFAVSAMVSTVSFLYLLLVVREPRKEPAPGAAVGSAGASG